MALVQHQTSFQGTRTTLHTVLLSYTSLDCSLHVGCTALLLLLTHPAVTQKFVNTVRRSSGSSGQYALSKGTSAALMQQNVAQHTAVG
jgi:hypothetical protein